MTPTPEREKLAGFRKELNAWMNAGLPQEDWTGMLWTMAHQLLGGCEALIAERDQALADAQHHRERAAGYEGFMLVREKERDQALALVAKLEKRLQDLGEPSFEGCS